MRRPTLLATLTTGLLLATPVAALAHPAFNPSSIPAGRTVDAVLVVPHGCAPGGGMPDMAEEGAPAEATVELAVQQQDGVTLVPGEVEGWDVTDDGEAWVWSDAGGATTDVLQFPVTITLDDDLPAGERRYLRAYQECVDGSAFQWIGTPDEEAQWPAVLLEVSDGAVGEAEADEGVQMDHGDMDMGDEEPMAMNDESMEDETVGMEMGDADDMDEDGEEAATDGGLARWLLLGLALVAVAGIGGTVVRSRSAG